MHRWLEGHLSLAHLMRLDLRNPRCAKHGTEGSKHIQESHLCNHADHVPRGSSFLVCDAIGQNLPTEVRSYVVDDG
jgi:hypothetical protein